MLTIIWLLCSLFTYATSLAYLQREFKYAAEDDYHMDVGISLLVAVFAGPLGILFTWVACKGWKYGFKLI